MAANNKNIIEAEKFPWERQPGEGIKAYEAFNEYLLMNGERSLSKVSRQLNKSVTLLGRWSSQYNWVERVNAYDENKLRLDRIEQQENIAKMRKRHATIATTMLAKVATKLKNMTDDDLTPQDIKAWVEVASKLERLARGDSGEVVENRDGGKAPSPVSIYIPDNGREDESTDE